MNNTKDYIKSIILYIKLQIAEELISKGIISTQDQYFAVINTEIKYEN